MSDAIFKAVDVLGGMGDTRGMVDGPSKYTDDVGTYAQRSTLLKATLPPEHRKKRRSVMITPSQEHFVETMDPTGSCLFPRGLAEILRLAGYKVTPPKTARRTKKK